jgi:hypothetical protein
MAGGGCASPQPVILQDPSGESTRERVRLRHAGVQCSRLAFPEQPGVRHELEPRLLAGRQRLCVTIDNFSPLRS